MGGGNAAFHSTDMQHGSFEADLIPPEFANLTGATAMPIGQQQHGRVPVPLPIVLGGLDQSLHFGLGQVLPGA